MDRQGQPLSLGGQARGLVGGGVGKFESMAPAESLDNGLTSESVAARAGGRPPEESDSDDPEEQAHAILEESEDRTVAGAEKSAETGN
jgi:hypothetical protein